MSGQVTLEMIYEEVKRLGERLRLIEDVIAMVLERSLPEAELSREEIEDIQRSVEEMKRGNYVTLEELSRA
ncbi:MAG: hypothetical protein N0A00_06245 [Candidatus Bathyarchaeota archaeon]|nr:hypothetical protein [Candidatus Bathyarchaeota archaeon]